MCIIILSAFVRVRSISRVRRFCFCVILIVFFQKYWTMLFPNCFITFRNSFGIFNLMSDIWLLARSISKLTRARCDCVSVSLSVSVSVSLSVSVSVVSMYACATRCRCVSVASKLDCDCVIVLFVYVCVCVLMCVCALVRGYPTPHAQTDTHAL